MLDWLQMNLGTIVVLAVVLFAIVAAGKQLRKNKKEGKSSCGCSCGSCSMGCRCSSAKK